MTEFPARLGAKEKLVTVLVGAGVGLGVPAVLGTSFAAATGDPRALALMLPFAAVFGASYAFRPTGYRLLARELSIERLAGASLIPFSSIVACRAPARMPRGLTIGLLRAEGFFGSFGWYWNRAWGTFRVFVTDSRRLVEIVLDDGRRVVISPSEPEVFRVALVGATRGAGAEIVALGPDDEAPAVSRAAPSLPR